MNWNNKEARQPPLGPVKILGFMTILSFVFFVSCKPTQLVPENEHLLNSMRVKTNPPGKLDGDALKAIVKQKPNKYLLGIYRFHLNVYNLASLGKTRRWKTWLKENVGEEPVILDTLQTSRSAQQLQLYINKKGYFKAKVESNTIYRRKKARVVYSVSLGKQSTIHKYSYVFASDTLRRFLELDTIHQVIGPGSIYDEDRIVAERDRIVRYLRNQGFFGFSDDLVTFSADTAFPNQQVNLVCKVGFSANRKRKASAFMPSTIEKVVIFSGYDPKKRDQSYDVFLDNGKKQVFAYSGVLPYRRNALLQSVFVNPGELFSQTNTERTYNSLAALRSFSSIKIDYVPTGDSIRPKLRAEIRLAPAKKQAYSLELQGSHSAGNYGIQGNITYQNKNVFKGSEIFQVRTGLEIKQVPIGVDSSFAQQVTLGAFNTIELGPEISLIIPRQFPRLGAKNPNVIRKTSLSVSANYQKNPNYFRTILNGNLGYSWVHGPTTWTFYPIELNFINVTLNSDFENLLERLNDVLVRQRYKPILISDCRASYTFNDQVEGKPINSQFFKLSGEIAGIIPSALNRLFGSPKLFDEEGDKSIYYRFMGIDFRHPYAEYAKVEADYRYYIRTPDNQTLVFRAFGGVGYAFENSTALPFIKSFFAGGGNDLRAWLPRTLGPGTYYRAGTRGIENIGDVKLTLNIEHRFKVYKYLDLATYIDAGNIWLLNSDSKTKRPGGQFLLNRFYRQLAVGTGLGFRFDFSFFIIRLDTGIPIFDPSKPEGLRWVISRLTFRDVNFLNLGIGYPF
jgi:hypothetical protein